MNKHSHLLSFVVALVATIMCSLHALAQPSFAARNQESAAAIKTSTLFVVASERDEKAAKRFSKKPEELKKYYESVDAINGYLKKAVENNWDASKEVKFIKEAEAEELSKGNDSGFILKVIEISNHKIGDFYGQMGSGAAGKTYNQNPANFMYHMSNPGKTVALAIAPVTKPKSYVVESYLPVIGISQLAFTFMVKHLKNQVIDGANGVTKFSEVKDEIEKKRGSLKDKTLLLFEPLISRPLQKAIDGGSLKKQYEYPCEVSTLENVEKAVNAKDNKYAFIWVTPAGAVSTGGESFNYFVIDAEDCRPLFVTGTGVMGSQGEFHPYTLSRVSKKLD